MALLGNDFDRTAPAHNDTPTQGYAKIDDVKARVQDWANVEHDGGTGVHKIPRGTTNPSGTVVGQLFINTSTGYDELYECTVVPSAWNKLTTNQTVATYSSALTTHETLADLTQSGGHAVGSVTRDMIPASAIVTKHVMGGTSAASIADVFNGSANGNTYHRHNILKKDLDGSADATSLATLVQGTATTLHTHATVGLGARVNKSLDQIYLATTDGFVVAWNESGTYTSGMLTGYTDGANPPTTKAGITGSVTSSSTSVPGMMMFPVKKNDYWKVSGSNYSPTVYFIPLGA